MIRHAKKEDADSCIRLLSETKEDYPPQIKESILKKLAAIAVERGCGRLEWWCLDWNQPSIDFYLSLGAQPMSDWTVYRIDGNALKEMAKQ